MYRARLNKVLRVRNQNAAIAYQRKLKVMHQSYTNILLIKKPLVDLLSTFFDGASIQPNVGVKNSELCMKCSSSMIMTSLVGDIARMIQY